MSKENPLKIVEFQAANTKRLKAVTIRPDPDNNLVVLTGKNRQGKTSVLDSIWFALGGKSAIPAKPIRDGETEAFVSVDLGEYIVIRRFTEKGEYLEVKTREGFAAKSPQQFLNSRLGGFAENPLNFMGLKPEEQVKALQGMIEIKLDVAELGRISGLETKGLRIDDPIMVLDAAYKKLYEDRTAVNNEVKRLDGAAKTAKAAIPSGKEETSAVSVAELFEKRKGLETVAATNKAERDKLDAIKGRHEDLLANIGTLDKIIEDFKKRLSDAIEKRNGLAEQANAATEEYNVLSAKIETLIEPDFTGIDAEISAADETNRIAAAIQTYNKTAADLETEKIKSTDLTNKLTAVKEYKGRLIVEAGLPVQGLGFENGEVTYNGVPLSQASTSEQIEISCAICISSHPAIRVLTIDVGWNELDSESKAILRTWAEKTGTQIWVTKVTDEAESEGIHIFDGEVAAVDGKIVSVGTEAKEAV